MNAFLSEIIKRPHPAIVHIPISLYPISLLFSILFMLSDNGQYLNAGYWAYLLASLSILFVSLTGLLDYARLKAHSEQAHKYLMGHLVNGIVITVAGLVSGIYFWNNPPFDSAREFQIFLTCSVLLSLLVLAQGALGAIMVYQHRLGIDGETR